MSNTSHRKVSVKQRPLLMVAVCSLGVILVALPLLKKVFTKRPKKKKGISVQEEASHAFSSISSRSERFTLPMFRSAIGLVGDSTFTDAIFHSLDTNQDGEVSQGTFLQKISVLLGGTFEDRIRFAFEIMDADKSGKLAKEEFLHFANSGGMHFGFGTLHPEEFFDTLDTDHTGEITYEQYLDGIRTMQSLMAPSSPRGSKSRPVFPGHIDFDLVMRFMLCIRHSVRHAEDIVDLSLPPQRRRMWLEVGDSVISWEEEGANLFLAIRTHYGITNAAVEASLGVDQFIAGLMLGKLPTLSVLNSMAKSDARFFQTYDERFILKIIKEKDFKKLMKILPKYVAHVVSGGVTPCLLSVMCGMYRIPSKGKMHYVLLMTSAFGSCDIARTYDLKGATFGRTAHPTNMEATTPTTPTSVPQYLDGDVAASQHTFDVGESRVVLLDALRRDVNFLISCGVYDYSVLVGEHRDDDLCTPLAGTAFHTVGTDHTVTSFCIVDILTEYSLRRMVEWYVKSWTCLFRESVSALPPGMYGNRLVKFMSQCVV